jgi:hypothetical protein
LQRIQDEFQRHLHAVDAKLTVPDYHLWHSIAKLPLT